ncbi:MAG: N-acetyltransferase [Chloroflexota bacterium]|nr:N-acetyltransferase [Chloroflexota bacterium]
MHRMNMKRSSKISYQIEEEQTVDIPGIRKVNLAAFKGQGEANVVDKLRYSCQIFISLVAKREDKVIGHILFTPVLIITPDQRTINGMGLAPLAILPEFHGCGIGSELCRVGIEKISMLGYPFVVVLGHSGYYSRFGFVPAKKYSITCSFQEIPDDAFMIHVFDAETMKNVTGTANYRHEFNEVT